MVQMQAWDGRGMCLGGEIDAICTAISDKIRSSDGKRGCYCTSQIVSMKVESKSWTKALISHTALPRSTA